MRLLHLSDLHLGSRHPELGDRAALREREVQESFQRAVELALDPDRAIDAVVIAGNLFDHHRPPEEAISLVRGLFGRLHAANKPVLLLPGARDGLAYRDSVYRTERFPGVTLFTDEHPDHPLEVEIGGERVLVHSAVGRADLSPTRFPGFERSPEDALQLGVLCAPLYHSDEFDHRPRVWHVHDAQVASFDLDYVALGGMHAFNSVESGGRVYGAWPGTLEGRRFEPGDFGEKCLLIVDLARDRRPKLERLPFSRRRLEEWRIDLASEEIREQRDLLAALASRGSEDLIARVTIEGPASFLPDLEGIRRVAQRNYFHLDLVDHIDLEGGPLVARLEGEKTIRGVFVRRISRRIAELRQRLADRGSDSPLERELEVARLALRRGLEHFLEEEPLPASRTRERPERQRGTVAEQESQA